MSTILNVFNKEKPDLVLLTLSTKKFDFMTNEFDVDHELVSYLS